MSKSMVVPVRQYAETANGGADAIVVGAYAVAANRFFRMTDIFVSAAGVATNGAPLVAAASFWVTTGGVGVGRCFKLFLPATGSIEISFETPLEFIGASSIYVTALAGATDLTRAGYLGELHYAS